MNYSRATAQTTQVLRNPVATGSAGCLVGAVIIFWKFLVLSAIATYLILKWTALAIYLLVAGVYFLATKGAPAARDLFRRSRHQFHVGRGEITASDARDLEAAPRQYKPGQWYPGVGVVPKERD